jgi:hypothetical protein
VPASQRSVDVTEAYRGRVRAIRDRVQARARDEWPTIAELDTSRWPARMAVVVAGAQTEAVRATAGYLTAFLATEGARSRPVLIDTRRYVGVSRDGRPLAEALESPLVGVRAALAGGKSPYEAIKFGLGRATRMVGVDLDYAHRTALTDTLDADDRFDGWARVTSGTCGACLSLSGSTGEFDVHPGCSCVAQPRVRGVIDRFPVATAAVLFERMTREEQDSKLGADTAEALRAGDIDFPDLVQKNRLKTGDTDFITQRPLDATG